MDDVDRRLVAVLRANARATYAELGRLVGLSGPSVQDRIRRLEDRGVITGYHAAIAPEAVGLRVAAIIGIYLTDAADQDGVAAELSRLPEVEACWFVAGEESFLAKVRTNDAAGLERLLGRLRQIKGLARTRTTVVLSTKWEDRIGLPGGA
jgi:Lrp/AsnC family transcriptional regulator, leucine-responsive regulatory protein